MLIPENSSKIIVPSGYSGFAFSENNIVQNVDIKSIIFSHYNSNDNKINFKKIDYLCSYISFTVSIKYINYKIEINKYLKIGKINIYKIELKHLFEENGFQIIENNILNTPTSELDLSQLSKAELNEINYWKPVTYNEILFNEWD